MFTTKNGGKVGGEAQKNKIRMTSPTDGKEEKLRRIF